MAAVAFHQAGIEADILMVTKRVVADSAGKPVQSVVRLGSAASGTVLMEIEQKGHSSWLLEVEMTPARIRVATPSCWAQRAFLVRLGDHRCRKNGYDSSIPEEREAHSPRISRSVAYSQHNGYFAVEMYWTRRIRALPLNGLSRQ
jgi:hypothetical protein